MIPKGEADMPLNQGIPRESGDDLVSRNSYGHFPMYSPRERG